MAISANQGILSLLKIWYKDGVENLMFRNSPVLGKLNKVRVEGKSQNFSAMYGRGGAVGADFVKAKANAASVSKNVEFAVTPGQIFSVYTVNAKEVQASKTNAGAYMKVAGAKMFAASEGFRKTIAAALYGRGYGELCASDYTTAIVANTAFEIELPTHAIMKIDIGTNLVLKTAVDSTTVNTTLEVQEINGNIVKVLPDTSVAAPVATDILALDGSLEPSGEPAMPMGLDGWLPTVGNRDGNDWATYIAKPFFGVNRAIATDRLAGAFYRKTDANEKVSTAVQKLLQKVRRQGSLADLIVMNDEDFLTLATEIEATNTFFTQTSTKGKKDATVGFNDVSASFSTSYIENIVDDPYCPKGRFYILDTTGVELWSYTNTEKLDTGIAGNNPGKQDPMTMNDEGKADAMYGLIIDDYLTVNQGADAYDGSSTAVAINFFGSFVVTNPSVCAVGLLA